MPGTFVYASIGNGISVLLQSGERPDLSVMHRATGNLRAAGRFCRSRRLHRFYGGAFRSALSFMVQFLKTDICVLAAGRGACLLPPVRCKWVPM